jgi:hypothetical protein
MNSDFKPYYEYHEKNFSVEDNDAYLMYFDISYKKYSDIHTYTYNDFK